MMPQNRTFRQLMEQLPAPADYFEGVAPREARVPFNILLFSRLQSSSLYSQEGRPSLHRRCVLITNFETEGSVILDGRWLKIRPGNCLLILPHQIHAFADIASPRMGWFFVTFDLAHPNILEPLRNRTLETPPPCAEWMTQLITCWKHHPDRTPFLVGLILNELLERAEKRNLPKIPPRKGLEEIVVRLHRMLEAEPGLRIKELARRLGISEPHLRAEFRRRTQLSLGYYIRQFRFNRAAILLTSTSHSIGEIATRCGFESLYSFSRSFRTAMGWPPREYRTDFLRSRPEHS